MVKLKVSALVATAAVALVGLGVVWSQDQLPPPAPATAVDPNPPVVLDVPLSAPADAAAGTSIRSANFEVYAPTLVMARVIANEAEFHRRTYALKWLGKELPNWPKPCVIRFATGLGSNGGATTFTFAKDKDGNSVMETAGMAIHGDFMAALTNTLPHEVTHTVLASFFGKPVPRWADEGISLLSESNNEQANHDTHLRDLLSNGRGIRLKVLLPKTEYPQDIRALYTQSHSLARFLVSRTKGVPALKDIPHLGETFKTGSDDGHRRLLAFVALGLKDNTTEGWGKAAKAVYGFDSVDALEEAWLEWLAKPESILVQKDGPPRPVPMAKSEDGDLIPPVKLLMALTGTPPQPVDR